MIEVTLEMDEENVKKSICGKAAIEKTVKNDQYHIANRRGRKIFFTYSDDLRQKTIFLKRFHLLLTHHVDNYGK